MCGIWEKNDKKGCVSIGRRMQLKYKLGIKYFSISWTNYKQRKGKTFVAKCPLHYPILISLSWPLVPMLQLVLTLCSLFLRNPIASTCYIFRGCSQECGIKVTMTDSSSILLHNQSSAKRRISSNFSNF